MEIWKEIDGYYGLYKISNIGRVKSFKYKCERILKLKTNNKGYKWITLCLDGVKKNYLIHRLVATYFLDNKNNCEVVNHIDEDPSNNDVSNLEWCSQSENIKKSSKLECQNKINKDICKTRLSKNKDTNNKVQQLLGGNIVKTFKNSIEVEKFLGFDKSFILSCCRNKRKSAYGYQWQFV